MRSRSTRRRGAGFNPNLTYLAVGLTVLGLLVSVFLVRDTREHVRLEMEEHPQS